MNQKYLSLFILFLAVATGMYAQAYKIPRTRSVELPKPVTLPASGITEKGFTANWEAVPNAEAYCVFVYTEHIAVTGEEYTLVNETFDSIDFGTIADPVWGDETYQTLDEYTTLPNWSVYAYASFAQGMVSGVIYSPYIDLRNNNGTYKITLTVYGTAGDNIYVHSSGTTDETQSFLLAETGLNTASLTFSNGRQDTYFYINNSTQNDFFLDEVKVTQQLKAGDQAYVLVDLNEAVTDNATSAQFYDLKFAPHAKQLFYDLYAVTREYDDPGNPDEYVQSYSEFSDKMEVNLSGSVGIGTTDTKKIKAYGASDCLCLFLSEAAKVEVYTLTGKLVKSNRFPAGDHRLPIMKGNYIICINGQPHKLYIF